jgi:microcystin-dependent protein
MANPIPGTTVPVGSAVNPGGSQGVQGIQGIVGSEDVGSIKAWPSVTPPVSWMIADGSAISRATYPDLWALLGTTFGSGDGSTTFNLPDLRSKMIVGQGQGTGLTNRALAALGGEETHTHSIAELPAHNHAININESPHNHLQNAHNHVAYGSLIGPPAGSTAYQIAGSGTAFGIGNTTATNIAASTGITATSVNTGSGTPFNVMAPFLVLVYVIKVSKTGGATAQAPIADSTQSGLLRQVSGNTTDFVDGTNNCQNLAAAIWSVRLRSWNSVGNCSFEVDQRNTFATQTNPAIGKFLLDRWVWINGVGAINVNTSTLAPAAGSPIVIPGTSFSITNRYLRITNQAVYSTPASTDYCYLVQYIEGPMFRELSADVHSVSLLVRTSVASLSFGLWLGDSSSNTQWSLSKLCTISSPNTWTLITLPNLPIWPSSGTFPILPGNSAYQLGITLLAGSASLPPANNVWQNKGYYYGAIGQSNFFANSIGSTFDIAFVQHEPGSQCTTLIDKPFEANLWSCKRYYDKSYPYTSVAGSVVNNGWSFGLALANTWPQWSVPFKTNMAKSPTITGYSHVTGAVNTVRDITGNVDRAISGALNQTDTGFNGFQTGTTNAANAQYGFHWVADTGW